MSRLVGPADLPSQPSTNRPRWSRVAPAAARYEVWVELGEDVDGSCRVDDIRRQLADYRAVVTTSGDGSTEIRLDVPDLDVWSATLNVMAGLTQLWLEPQAVHIVRAKER